jgi:hypothetical protein
VPRATGGPTWATILVAVAPMAPLVAVRSNTDALIDVFTAGTLMPAITYTGTVLLYATVARHIKREPGFFHLGRWQQLVITGALVWLAYELVILLVPDIFRAAQRYALVTVLLGVIVFGLMWLLEPSAMRRQANPLGERAPEAIDEPLTEQEQGHLRSS